MKVDVVSHGVVAVVTPHGPLIRDELPSFREVADPTVLTKDGRVVLDMHDVPYLDSGGIEAVLELSTAMGTSGRPRLAHLDETCREALTLTRILEQLEVFDTVESAVRSYKH